jgi:hypothetical protein
MRNIKSSDGEEKKGSDCEARVMQQNVGVGRSQKDTSGTSQPRDREGTAGMNDSKCLVAEQYMQAATLSTLSVIVEVPPFDFQISRDCGVSGGGQRHV